MNQSGATTSGAATVGNIAYCYVLPVVCIVGIIGNITNLIVLASRRLRAVSYMYLRALALADLLCMIFSLIFTTTEILQKNGVSVNQYKLYAVYQCHLMLTMINWALGAGVFVVVALSLERYISIVFPMHFRAWNSPQRATKAIAIAYVIPAMLYIPYALTRYRTQTKWDETSNSTIYKLDDNQIYRTLEWQAYKWTRETLLRFLPIIVLSVLNIQIMIAFRKRQKMFEHLTNKRKEHSTQKDDTLMYMLGGTVLMSLICNIPAAINLLLIDETLKKRLDYQIFRAVANILEITNHASQFYVFCACSTDYRTTFLLKFPCFKKNFANKSRLTSFVQRTQSLIVRDKPSHPKVGTPQRVCGESSSLSHSHVSRLSRGCPIEQDTVRDSQIDIHLASGDESSSESPETEVFIKYGAVAKLKTDTNGSTFL